MRKIQKDYVSKCEKWLILKNPIQELFSWPWVMERFKENTKNASHNYWEILTN